ncbi:MAG TPA: hypothetical protein PL000_21860 [Anaerolineales bacterium]|nr:hypothetical protein [Anaerolineales bacterium]
MARKKPASQKAGYAGCIDAIRQSAGAWLSDKDAEVLLEEIDKVVQRNRARGKLESIEDQVLNAIDGATNAMKEAALIEKRNALINARIKEQVHGYLDGFQDKAEGLLAYLGGGVKLRQGGKLSIDAREKSIVNGILGKLINSLEQEKLLPFFTSGELDDDIARELWALGEGRAGITKNQEALGIAEIINAAQTELVGMQNRAGAHIRMMPGYIVRQSHDVGRIRAAGQEAWTQFVLPLLNEEKTFGNMEVAPFLEEAYMGFSTGLHMKQRGEEVADDAAALLGFTGPGNLAKKISANRVLHFKDADSWLKYNEAFGQGSLRESILWGVESASKNLALMEGLGTNPESMFKTLIGELKEASRNDPEAFDKLNNWSLEALYRQIDGSARIPANRTLAAWGSGIRVLQNMAKLGFAVLSSVTDIPFQAAALKYNGVSLFEAYINAFANVLRGRGDADRKEIARLVGSGFQGILSDIASRFAAEDNIPGLMAKLQQKFFKLNLMNWWNDAHKSGVAVMLSNHLGGLKDMDFSALPDATKRMFKLYDINEREWNAIRSTAWERDGDWYLTPDRIAGLDESRMKEVYSLNNLDISSESFRELRKLRDSLEVKFRAYLTNQIESAIPHPDARVQSLLNLGTQAGTPLGEAVRFIMQFKSFPIAVLRRGVAPFVYGNGAESFSEALFKGKADYAGLAHIMVASTVFGYLAMVAKDTVRGRTPKDPTDPKTIIAAMTQGGGLGIYGDFVFGEFNKYGHSAIATLSGPTVGQFEDLARLYSRAKEGDSVAGQSLRVMMNNTPFANLFYTRAALDYLFLHNLQETVNPGYLSRMEQRIQRESGQHYYLPPTQVIPYGGR